MSIVLLSEKGQVTIPQYIRRKLHISKGDPLLIEMADDGSILLRSAAVLPVEMYSPRRLREFEKEDEMSPVEKRRLAKKLHGRDA